jgi:hypothetical protein
MNNIMKIVGRPARAWRTRRDQTNDNPKSPAFDPVAFAAVLEVMG